MPELPEVEVLRRSLDPLLPGDRLVDVTVRQPRLREPIDLEAIRRCASNRRIVALRRRAKYLLIDLAPGSSRAPEAESLIIHLGMSGRLTLVAHDAAIEPHEHLSFRLASGKRLRFRDPRRFGLVLCLPTAQIETDRHFSHLGIEPLGGKLSGQTLVDLAKQRRGPVKSFLMDARVVVGVGNIYASEALHRAGVHPARKVNRIAAARWRRLADAVRETLAQAIAEGGTTLNDFADGEGNSGYFQVALAVYDREGERCQRCDRTIRRIVQTGRSTFYCPGCQR